MAGSGEFQVSARRQVRGVCATPGPEYRVAACVIAGDSRFSRFPGLRSSGSPVEDDAIYDFRQYPSCAQKRDRPNRASSNEFSTMHLLETGLDERAGHQRQRRPVDPASDLRRQMDLSCSRWSRACSALNSSRLRLAMQRVEPHEVRQGIAEIPGGARRHQMKRQPRPKLRGGAIWPETGRPLAELSNFARAWSQSRRLLPKRYRLAFCHE